MGPQPMIYYAPPTQNTGGGVGLLNILIALIISAIIMYYAVLAPPNQDKDKD